MSKTRRDESDQTPLVSDDVLHNEQLAIGGTIYFLSTTDKKNRRGVEQIEAKRVAKTATEIARLSLNEYHKWDSLSQEKYTFRSDLVVTDGLSAELKLQENDLVIIDCNIRDYGAIDKTKKLIDEVQKQRIDPSRCMVLYYPYTAFDKLSSSGTEREGRDVSRLNEIAFSAGIGRAHECTEETVKGISEKILDRNYEAHKRRVLGAECEDSFHELTDALVENLKQNIQRYDRIVDNRNILLSSSSTFGERQDSRNRAITVLGEIKNSQATPELKLRDLLKTLIREIETIKNKQSFLEKIGVRESALEKAYRTSLHADRKIPREYIDKLTAEVKAEMKAEKQLQTQAKTKMKKK